MDGRARARAGAHRVGAVAVAVVGGGVASLFHGLNSVSGEKKWRKEGKDQRRSDRGIQRGEGEGRKEGAVAPTTVK